MSALQALGCDAVLGVQQVALEDPTGAGSATAVTHEPGTLDPAFGQGGITAWRLERDGGALNDIRETAQQKILVGGFSVGGLGGEHFIGARLLPDGALDTSWNATGTVSERFCACTKAQEGRAILPTMNGKVFLLGTASKGPSMDYDIAVARFKADGTADDVAGDLGHAMFDLGGDERVFSAELTPDEHFMVVGDTTVSGITRAFVARLGDGYFDRSFAGTGYVLGSPGTSATAVAFDAAGLAIVALQEGDDVRVTRYTATGAVSASTRFSLPGKQVPVAISVLSDSSVIVAATTDAPGSTVLVAHLDATLAFDPLFGEGGLRGLDVSGGTAVDMVVLPDRRIVVAGNTEAPFLARFLANGTPDPTLDNGAGFTRVDLGRTARVQSLTVASDGKLLVGGTRDSFPTNGIVARLWN